LINSHQFGRFGSLVLWIRCFQNLYCLVLKLRCRWLSGVMGRFYNSSFVCYFLFCLGYVNMHVFFLHFLCFFLLEWCYIVMFKLLVMGLCFSLLHLWFYTHTFVHVYVCYFYYLSWILIFTIWFNLWFKN